MQNSELQLMNTHIIPHHNGNWFIPYTLKSNSAPSVNLFCDGQILQSFLQTYLKSDALLKEQTLEPNSKQIFLREINKTGLDNHNHNFECIIEKIKLSQSGMEPMIMNFKISNDDSSIKTRAAKMPHFENLEKNSKKLILRRNQLWDPQKFSSLQIKQFKNDLMKEICLPDIDDEQMCEMLRENDYEMEKTLNSCREKRVEMQKKIIAKNTAKTSSHRKTRNSLFHKHLEN